MISDEKIEHIKNFESNSAYSKNIIRPLSSLFDTIKKGDARLDSKIGLIIGHGHNHPNEGFTKLKFVNYWYMIDIDASVFPDYICDAYNTKQLEYFPDEIFDYIYDLGGMSSIDVSMFDNFKRLLKKSGYFIAPYIKWTYHIKDDILDKINKELINKDPSIIDCLKKADHIWYHDNLTENQNIWNVLYGVCYPMKRGVDDKLIENENIRILDEKYTRKLLKHHGYKYIKKKGPYLYKGFYVYTYIFIKPSF